MSRFRDPLERVAFQVDAGEIEARTLVHDEERPVEANFNKQVRPFAVGWGMSMSSAAFGSTWLLSMYTGVADMRPSIALAISAFGVGYGLALLWMKDDFAERLWRIEHRSAEFAPPTVAPRERPTFLHTEPSTNVNHYSKLPLEPSQGAMRYFISRYLNGNTPLSEAGAREFGYTSAGWEKLKDFLFEQRLIRWKDNLAHQQGLEPAGAAGRAALRAIANGEYKDDTSPTPRRKAYVS